MDTNKVSQLHCGQCSAVLKFKPGTHSLACEYCGFENPIESEKHKKTVIQEFDIETYEQEIFNQEQSLEATLIKCTGCSAETTLGNQFSSKACPFCGTPLVVQKNEIKRMHKPHYILPFMLTEKQAIEAFQIWIKKLWFAPSSLKRYAVSQDKLRGMYLPFWSYDCIAESYYQGERGDEYTVQVRNEKGEPVSEVRVRWHKVHGRVGNVFDDILIPATKSLPKSKLEQLEPWDLNNLKPYNEKYLQGFTTENYRLSLRQGYAQAQQKMRTVIEQSIRRDIGGDRQNIHQLNIQHREVKFKHILLPTWVSAYRFKHKVYQFVVNARTGEVQGGRPYSVVKIVLLVIAIFAFIYALSNIDWSALKMLWQTWVDKFS